MKREVKNRINDEKDGLKFLFYIHCVFNSNI